MGEIVILLSSILVGATVTLLTLGILSIRKKLETIISILIQMSNEDN